MIIGVPKQVKNHEYRVGLTPHSVNECVRNGHKVVAKDLGYSYSPACDILK